MSQLVDGNPPPFYMNGNRATFLRANVQCTNPTVLWQQEATLEWIKEFDVNSSFLLPSTMSELRLGTLIEQDFVNPASFKRMLSTRLERCYRHLAERHCICAATYCSSDYLSLSMLNHLNKQVDLIFYLDESRTIPESPNRINSSLSPDLHTAFCSAVAIRDLETAIQCVDRAVEKLRCDMPSPMFAREKLNQFLWDFISLCGSKNVQTMPLWVDDSRISPMRESIIRIIRAAFSSDVVQESTSPMDELIRRIEANPGLTISIDQAAQEINFSRSHFCRLFRQQTGMSFTKFLTQKRIALACELLCKTGMRVDKIAETVGIGNAWYFKKLFEKEMGMTVEAYMVEKGKASDAIPDQKTD